MLNGQLKESREMEVSLQNYYGEKMNSLGEQLARSQNEVAVLNGRVAGVSLEYEAYKKQRSAEVEELGRRVREFESESGSLRGNSDSLAREYMGYRVGKEAEVAGLNVRLQAAVKEEAGGRESL